MKSLSVGKKNFHIWGCTQSECFLMCPKSVIKRWTIWKRIPEICSCTLGKVVEFCQQLCMATLRAGSRILVRGALSLKLLKIRVFPLQLPENCMILKKSWGPPGSASDPAVEGLAHQKTEEGRNLKHEKLEVERLEDSSAQCQAPCCTEVPGAQHERLAENERKSPFLVLCTGGAIG